MKKQFFMQIADPMIALLGYFKDLFGFTMVGTEIRSETKDIGKDGMTFFTAKIPKEEGFHSEYTEEEMKDIMQGYLENVILPNSQIPPYPAGEKIIEPLFIDRVVETGSFYIMDVIYINNRTSFRYVKNKKIGGKNNERAKQKVN